MNDALESIPQHAVQRRDPVDREIALKHAAIDAKLLDAVQVIGRHGLGHLAGTRRPGPLVPAHAAARHTEPAQLDRDVRARRQLCDPRLPQPEHSLALPGIGTDAQWTPNVVQDNGDIGESFGQVDQFQQLRMVQPGIETKAVTPQAGKSLAKPGIHKQSTRWALVRADLWACVPGCGMPDPAEPLRAGSQMGLKHRRHLGAEREVGKAHNAGCDSRRPAHRTHGRVLNECRFAHRSHGLGPIRPVHGTALDKDRSHHVVAAPGVPQHVLQQVAAAGPVPQVMVGVADGQVGIDCRFAPQRQPAVAIGRHVSSLASGSPPRNRLYVHRVRSGAYPACSSRVYDPTQAQTRFGSSFC